MIITREVAGKVVINYAFETMTENHAHLTFSTLLSMVLMLMFSGESAMVNTHSDNMATLMQGTLKHFWKEYGSFGQIHFRT